MRKNWPWLRVAAALLILAAIVAQLRATIGLAVENERDLATTIVNFFSFFTIQSNLLAAIMLLVGAFWTWRRDGGEDVEPRWLSVALAAVTTYMIVTGIVYNTLLRGIELPQGTTVPWSNEVLHVVGPLFLLLDLLYAPKRRLHRSTVVAIAAYPVVWAGYTLVRGPLTVNPVTGESWWYPYPFLNPRNPELTPPGYGGVAVYIVAIAATIIGVGSLVVWWNRRRVPQRAGRSPVAT